MTSEQEKDSANDLAIVQRVQQGDIEAYNILVLRYQHKICDIAYKYVNNYVDANDIAQEAFIKAFRAINSFRGDSSFYTWIFRIVTNTAKTYLEQHQKHKYTVDIDDPDFDISNDVKGSLVSNESPDTLIESEELSVAINKAIKELPEELRSALLLREVEGLSYDEISLKMSTPVGTVRSRIFRARQLVEDRLAHFTKGI